MLAVYILTGCAVDPSVATHTMQASLRQPCPKLEHLPSGTGEDLYVWALGTVKAYNTCASRQLHETDAAAK